MWYGKSLGLHCKCHGLFELDLPVNSTNHLCVYSISGHFEVGYTKKCTQNAGHCSNLHALYNHKDQYLIRYVLVGVCVCVCMHAEGFNKFHLCP